MLATTIASRTSHMRVTRLAGVACLVVVATLGLGLADTHAHDGEVASEVRNRVRQCAEEIQKVGVDDYGHQHLPRARELLAGLSGQELAHIDSHLSTLRIKPAIGDPIRRTIRAIVAGGEWSTHFEGGDAIAWGVASPERLERLMAMRALERRAVGEEHIEPALVHLASDTSPEVRLRAAQIAQAVSLVARPSPSLDSVVVRVLNDAQPEVADAVLQHGPLGMTRRRVTHAVIQCVDRRALRPLIRSGLFAGSSARVGDRAVRAVAYAVTRRARVDDVGSSLGVDATRADVRDWWDRSSIGDEWTLHPSEVSWDLIADGACRLSSEDDVVKLTSRGDRKRDLPVRLELRGLRHSEDQVEMSLSLNLSVLDPGSGVIIETQSIRAMNYIPGRLGRQSWGGGSQGMLWEVAWAAIPSGSESITVRALVWKRRAD